MATHSSTLAWRIPWREEPGGLQSMGSQRVGHDWATSLHFTNPSHKRKSCSFPGIKKYLSQSLYTAALWCPALNKKCVVHCSAAKSCLILRSHVLKYSRLPCPSLSPGVFSNTVHWVHDAIQPSMSPPSPAFNLSQHQGLYQWVGSSYHMANVLELQL